MLAETESGHERLTRRIITFREVGDDRFQRAEEIHDLNLFAPEQIIGALQDASPPTLRSLTERAARARSRPRRRNRTRSQGTPSGLASPSRRRRGTRDPSAAS